MELVRNEAIALCVAAISEMTNVTPDRLFVKTFTKKVDYINKYAEEKGVSSKKYIMEDEFYG